MAVFNSSKVPVKQSFPVIDKVPASKVFKSFFNAEKGSFSANLAQNRIYKMKMKADIKDSEKAMYEVFISCRIAAETFRPINKEKSAEFLQMAAMFSDRFGDKQQTVEFYQKAAEITPNQKKKQHYLHVASEFQTMLELCR